MLDNLKKFLQTDQNMNNKVLAQNQNRHVGSQFSTGSTQSISFVSHEETLLSETAIFYINEIIGAQITRRQCAVVSLRTLEHQCQCLEQKNMAHSSKIFTDYFPQKQFEIKLSLSLRVGKI